MPPVLEYPFRDLLVHGIVLGDEDTETTSPSTARVDRALVGLGPRVVYTERLTGVDGIDEWLCFDRYRQGRDECRVRDETLPRAIQLYECEVGEGIT
jgi:hypothetical protein